MAEQRKRSLAQSHRLLVGEGRYVTVEKQFESLAELRDWLAVNTLLTDESIDVLLARGEISFGENSKQEWFKYIPPRVSK